MTQLFTVEVTMPYLSGLPRDVAVNVIHGAFPDAITQEDAMADMQTAWSAFYNTAPEGGTNAIGVYMSGIIDRSKCVLKFYDGWTTPGLVPLGELPFSMADPSGPANMPLEVALAVSLVGSGLGVALGTPQPALRRRRGRVFHGPLTTVAVTGTEVDSMPEPAPEFLTDLKLAWNALLVAQTPGEGGTGLCVYSRGGKKPTPGVADGYVVTSGWIDNAWDTQRRRGMDATGRDDLTPTVIG